MLYKIDASGLAHWETRPCRCMRHDWPWILLIALEMGFVFWLVLT
jgi:hypothetical protein